MILQTAVHMRGEQAGQAVQVVGLDLLAELNTRGFRLNQPASESQLMNMIQPEAVFLGAKLAVEWSLSVDDSVDLLIGPRRLTCRVAGILHNESDRTSSWERMAVMDIAAAQITFEMVGKVDRIDIVTDENKAVEDVAQDLRTVLPAHVTVERPANRTRQVEQMVRAFRLNLTVLSWVGLLVRDIPDLQHDGVRCRSEETGNRNLSSDRDDSVSGGGSIPAGSRVIRIFGRNRR